MMSDMFMRNVLNILECAEYVLRVITENDDLELTEVVVQKDYKNLQGRSAILDCVAVNGRKEIYDIEVQQEKAGAGPKRLYQVSPKSPRQRSSCSVPREMTHTAAMNSAAQSGVSHFLSVSRVPMALPSTP